jgi:hypothetical protein
MPRRPSPRPARPFSSPARFGTFAALTALTTLTALASASCAGGVETGDTPATFVTNEPTAPRAEPLSSVSTTEPVEMGAPIPFAFVVDVGGKLHVVLNDAPDESWADGAPAIVHEASSDRSTVGRRSEADVLARRVSLAQLPADYANASGRRVRLFDANGERCEATLGAPVLTQRMVPGSIRSHGDMDGTDDVTTESPAERTWKLGVGIVLTAEAVPVEGSCEGATWARSASLGDVEIASAEKADPKLAAQALSFARTLPLYAEIQERYAHDVEGPRPARWEDHDSADNTVRVMTSPTGTFVWVSIRAGEGCGSFQGQMGTLLEATTSATGRRTFRAVSAGEHESSAIEGLVHASGEPPTLLFEDAKIVSDTEESVAPAYYGCGC